MQPVTTQELRKVIALSDLPEEHLKWIIERSEMLEYEDGTLIVKTGDPIEWMWLMIEGKLSFYQDMNGRLIHFIDFQNDEFTGGVGGLLPYSRMKSSLGNAYAVGKIRGLKLHKKHFPALEQLNPDFVQRLIGYMTDRARMFATLQMQQEKVSALGRLSAGIAHELNNPASAINRISSGLIKRLNLNFELTERMLYHCLRPEVIRHVQSLMLSKHDIVVKEKLTSLERVEKEDMLYEWLTEHNIENAQELSETFIEAGFMIEDLEDIRSRVIEGAFGDVLIWLENLLSSEKILYDLGAASARISKLVGAIKSHVHMDRSDNLNTTNIHSDIDNTLTLLGYKLREKNISVKKNFSEMLPEPEAYVGDLNQVWTNLIDNAIYAMPNNGELTIKTSSDNNNIYVAIIDNGTGIPKEIQSRIFDPFFTTKKVGEGTGIGLDLVQRIVKRHNGEVKVNSEPGRTEFCICIPVSQNHTNTS